MSTLPRALTLPAQPAATAQAARRAARRRARQERSTAWAFIGPSVVVILGLSVVPVVWSLLLSFRADDLVTPGRWVGLDNYRALAQDPNFRTAVSNTLLYAALYVPLSLVGGLARTDLHRINLTAMEQGR